jgi:hypothetical protein
MNVATDYKDITGSRIALEHIDNSYLKDKFYKKS